MEVPLDRDVDQFPVFELVLKKRGRIWRWSVCTSEGAAVMVGSESSRPAAKYQADRALFLLLLSAPYQSIRMSRRLHRTAKGRNLDQPETAARKLSGRGLPGASPAGSGGPTAF